MIPAAGYQGARVGVLGLGRSGLAVAKALLAGGATPVVWYDGMPAHAQDDARAQGFDAQDLSSAEVAAGLAKLVVSPGAPHLYPRPHPAIEAAWRAGAPVDNDIGLFFEALEALGAQAPKVAAITGSNGKSTTTALTGHILRAAGVESAIGGNIGLGVFNLPKLGPQGVYVLELSSYQTDLARKLRPDAAAFLNLSSDHLDRHGGVGGYFAAKRAMFEHCASAVVGVDEAEGRFLADRLRGRALTTVSVEKGFWPNSHICAEGGRIVTSGGARISLEDAPALRGAHNHQNAAVATALCLELGVSADQIAMSLRSFPGLPHRMQIVAEKNGVGYVNDSKATNAEAAARSLGSFERIRWIVGGRAKDGGVAALAPYFDRVEKAYLIGESSEAFAAQLSAAPHERCGDIATAVARAHAEARAGETVLLAPACASFDQFPDFEARGDAFCAAVKTALGEI